MRTRIALLGLVLGLLGGAWAQGPTVVPEIPFRQFTLPNGLRVILSEDHAVPVVTESLCFNVGGRDEHRGSSGFAHLFEHLMFEGSEHARKGVFDHLVEGYGGTDNASTHTDYTFYFETAPSNALPILMWLDADRMAYLNVTPENMKNQIAVVEEEKRLRVDNEPYGPLLYIDMGEDAFSNWQNAHPVIGSFADLDRATLAEVKAFFDSYYAPRNAILTIAGDIDPVRTEALVRKYFAWIPNRGTITPVVTAEPPRTRETDVTVRDPHANLPALAIAWQGPRRGTPEFYALALLGQDLFAGDSSRLYQSLVKTEKVAIEVDGGLNFPGGDFTDYRAPGLFGGFAIYKPTASAQLIEQLIFREIHEIAANGMPADELLRVKTKLASDWIRNEQTTLDRAQLLALGELMDGTPAGASEDLRKILNVTSEQIQAAAVEYLTHARATVIVNMPGAAAATAAKTGAKP